MVNISHIYATISALQQCTMRFLLCLAAFAVMLYSNSYAAERIIREMNIPATLSFIPQIVQDHPIIALVVALTVISYLILRIRRFLRSK